MGYPFNFAKITSFTDSDVGRIIFLFFKSTKYKSSIFISSNNLSVLFNTLSIGINPFEISFVPAIRCLSHVYNRYSKQCHQWTSMIGISQELDDSAYTLVHYHPNIGRISWRSAERSCIECLPIRFGVLMSVWSKANSVHFYKECVWPLKYACDYAGDTTTNFSSIQFKLWKSSRKSRNASENSNFSLSFPLSLCRVRFTWCICCLKMFSAHQKHAPENKIVEWNYELHVILLVGNLSFKLK